MDPDMHTAQETHEDALDLLRLGIPAIGVGGGRISARVQTLGFGGAFENLHSISFPKAGGGWSTVVFNDDAAACRFDSAPGALADDLCELGGMMPNPKQRDSIERTPPPRPSPSLAHEFPGETDDRSQGRLRYDQWTAYATGRKTPFAERILRSGEPLPERNPRPQVDTLGSQDPMLTAAEIEPGLFLWRLRRRETKEEAFLFASKGPDGWIGVFSDGSTTRMSVRPTLAGARRMVAGSVEGWQLPLLDPMRDAVLSPEIGEALGLDLDEAAGARMSVEGRSALRRLVFTPSALDQARDLVAAAKGEPTSDASKKKEWTEISSPDFLDGPVSCLRCDWRGKTSLRFPQADSEALVLLASHASRWLRAEVAVEDGGGLSFGRRLQDDEAAEMASWSATAMGRHDGKGMASTKSIKWQLQCASLRREVEGGTSKPSHPLEFLRVRRDLSVGYAEIHGRGARRKWLAALIGEGEERTAVVLEPTSLRMVGWRIPGDERAAALKIQELGIGMFCLDGKSRHSIHPAKKKDCAVEFRGLMGACGGDRRRAPKSIEDLYAIRAWHANSTRMQDAAKACLESRDWRDGRPVRLDEERPRVLLAGRSAGAIALARTLMALESDGTPSVVVTGSPDLTAGRLELCGIPDSRSRFFVVDEVPDAKAAVSDPRFAGFVAEGALFCEIHDRSFGYSEFHVPEEAKAEGGEERAGAVDRDQEAEAGSGKTAGVGKPQKTETERTAKTAGGKKDNAAARRRPKSGEGR